MTDKKERPTMNRWLAKPRSPATFNIRGGSSAFPGTFTEWSVVISEKGYVATRKADGRRVSITWKEAIGLAMFEGRDSVRGPVEKKL